MPIFNYKGLKYNVADEYVNDFISEYPDATAIEEHEGKVYRVKASDYHSFMEEFRAPFAPSAESIQDEMDAANKAQSAEEPPKKRITMTDALNASVPGMVSADYSKSVQEEQEKNRLTQEEKDQRAAMRQRLQEDGTIDRMKELRKEARRDKLRAFGSMLGSTPQVTSFGVSSNVFDSTDEQLADVGQALDAGTEYRQNKLLQEKLDVALDMARAGENQDGLRGVENFGLGLWDSATRLSTWDFGASDIVNNLTLMQIVEKWENDPSSLTATEKKVLDGIGMATAVQGLYSDQVGVGYNVGQSLPESASFMASMALNPASGLGKSLARNAVRTNGRNSIAKSLARIGGDIAETAIMTATTGAGRVAADALERINGSSTYEIGENGVIMYGGQRDQETVGDAVLKAIGSNFIENYSEALGEYFDPLLGMSRKVAAGGLRKMNLNKWADALSDVQPSQMTASIRALREKIKFGGILGEIMEEEVGMALNTLFVGDNQWSDFVDLETQLTTVLSCAIMSGTLNGVELVSSVAARRRMEKNAKNAEQEASYRFSRDKFAPLRDAIDQASPEGMVDVLRDVYMSQEYTVGQKRALAEYAAARLQLQYYNAADAKARRQVNKTQRELLDAQEAGLNAQLPQFYSIARAAQGAEEDLLDYEGDYNLIDIIRSCVNKPEEMERILGDLPRSEARLVSNYIYSRARMDGAYQGRSNRAEDYVDDFAYALEPAVVTDAEGNRTITTAIMGDRSVYVLDNNGDLAHIMYPDGSKTLVKASELTNITTSSAEEVIDRYRDMYTIKYNAETEYAFEHHPKTQAPQVGLQLLSPEGEVVITAVNDNMVEIVPAVYKDGQVQPKEGAEPKTITVDDAYMWQDSYYQGLDDAAATASQPTVDNMSVETTENPAFEQGDELTFYVNGEPIGAEITGITPEGKYLVQIDHLVDGLSKSVVDEYTTDELRELSAPSNNISAETTENESMPSEQIEQSVSEEVADGQIAETQPTETEGVAPVAPAAPQTARERVPMDDKGNLLYEQTDADTAWDAIVEETEGNVEMAQRVAADMLEDKKAALAKMQKGKPKKGTTVAEKIANEKAHAAAIAKAEADVKAWEKIAQVNAIRQQKAELERAEAEKAEAEQRRAEEARILAEQEEQARIEREQLNGVPDMVDDIPADARARGFRRVNGHKVERQGVLPAAQGKEVGVKFANDMIANGRVAVIEAETLQPSHLQGQRNPAHFIDEAQPKERNDEASIASARKIASNIRPEEITTSVTAYTGAPTVNMRGEAIQGNSRSDALRVMWAEHPDQAEKYKQYLIDHSEEFGLDAEQVAAMQHPVLVNMLDVSDADAINLGQYVAQDTESGGTERIKPKNVARKMGSDIRSYANILLRSSEEDASFAELVDKNGVEVLKWMNTKGYITPTQYASAFDSKGNLTAEAKNDLRGILYQSIFQGGNTQLEEQFNALPAKAQKAILATAYRDYDSPESERMVGEIQSSIRAYYALSHDRAFVEAKNYADAKEAMLVWARQYQMDDVTGESFLPSENFSNFALELAVRYKGNTQSATQNLFNELFDLIQGTKEASLFEGADNRPRTLAEAIKETLNIDYNGQYGSNALVGDDTSSQEGRQGSSDDSTSGELPQNDEPAADDRGRTAGDSNTGAEEARGRNTAPVAESSDEYILNEGEKTSIDKSTLSQLKNFQRTLQGNLFLIEQIEKSGELTEELAARKKKDTAWLNAVKDSIARKEQIKAKNKWNVKSGNHPVALDIVKLMFAEWNENADIQALFDRVFDTFSKLGVNVTFEDNIGSGTTQGWFSIGENRVKLPMHMVYSNRLDNQQKASVMVHEMIHGVTKYVLWAAKLSENGRNKLGINLTQGMMTAAEQLNEIYGIIKNDDRFKGQYGLTSVDEMVSELSEPEFRALLKETTVWDKIIEAIRNILGLNAENNALDAASRALDYIIDNYDTDLYRKVSSLGKKKATANIFDIAEDVLAARELQANHKRIADNLGEAEYTQEEQEIIAKAKTDGTYMKAPDGEPSNLTPKQWAQVRTKAFIKWFGDWINDPKNASQIVDENGEPRVVYHGTDADFTVFDKSRGRANMDIQGMFFSPWEDDSKGYGPNVRAFFVNIKNPAGEREGYAALRRFQGQNGAGVKAREYLVSLEYDGVNNGNEEFIAFASNQIKSATENNGEFSESDDIRFRDGAPFYSNAERAVENIKQDKATPEQWLAMIKKDGGLKAGEDKWMGLSDWLSEKKEAGVKSLTKDEVLEFIRENEIQIEEVEYAQSHDYGYDEDYNAIAEEIDDAWDDYVYEAQRGIVSYGQYRELDDVPMEQVQYHVREKIKDIYGDDIFDHIEIDENGNVFVLGETKPINSTRLDYTTEGLDNKKEIAFVIPTIESWNQSDNIHFGDAGDGRAVAWVRFGETTDADGKRVLVIDEVQSKRHDEGRSKGYSDLRDYDKKMAALEEEAAELLARRNKLIKVLDEKYGGFTKYLKHSFVGQRTSLVPNPSVMTAEEIKEWNETSQDSIREREDELKKLKRGIPDAPFDKNYHELVMKRMLRYAAENGYDKVAWTKGAQQAERYNLGGVVDKITSQDYGVDDNGDAIRLIQIRLKGEKDDLHLEVNKDGIIQTGGQEYEGKHLGNVVGKDTAVKLMTNDTTISGNGLRVGDEGRGALYDEMIPRFMNKYTKKWGTKVSEVTLPNVEKAGRTMWSVDVTPEMRESVMQGQPMFRKGMGAISDREVSYENDPIAKWQGKPRYTGKKAAAFAMRERKRMVQAANEVSKILGLNVEVVTDTSTLQGRKAKAKGWYDINSKKVTVVIPNHVSAWDAVQTVLHEGVAHHGLRELFGDGFDSMLDNVYNNVSPELKAKIDAIAAERGVDARTATEEYLASLAEETNFEEAKKQGWWQEIKQFFVNMLNKIAMPGLKMKESLTDNELRYLLWRSYRNLVEPNSYAKPLGYAQDVVKQVELKVGQYAEKVQTAPMVAEANESEMSEADEWAAVTMQRIEELEAQAAQLENEIAEMEADRDADDASRYEMWEQQLEPLRKQMEDVYAELEGLYSLEAEAEEMSMASEEGLRYRRKDSIRRQERNRINNNYESAVSLLFGIDKKKVREERIAREKKRREDAKEIYDSVLSGDFNDVTLQKINDYINDATPQNPFGRRISQRLPQKLERGLYEGARTNAVDALFSRISESAVPANERISEAGRRKAEERKKELLKGWAIATGNWHTDLSAFVDDTTPIGEGTDSKVYLAKDGAHVIKASKGKPYGKRFRPDMDNIALFNRVFYNSRYEIVGYGEIDGEFVRILKQPIVDFTGTTPLTPDERVEYMKGLKFEPINDSKTAFSNGEIVISDLQKSNIVKDAAGNISVIDADAKLHTKDVGGNYTYPPVEADLPQNENLQEKDDIAIEDSANIESRNSEEIIAEVERESANLGVQVRIARSIDELPDEDTRKRAMDGQLKGYFDPRTGEVVLYEPNTDNANDAKRTILHEIVGHKGLRSLIGEQRYDKAMLQLMYMLPADVRDAVLRRAERHGWNAAIAMDEYLAEQAERDVQPTWWGKVNAKIRALLRNIGFNVMLTDADVTYLLWRSRKRLMGDTAYDMAINAIKKNAAKKEAVNAEEREDEFIREREAQSQESAISDAITNYYEKYTATTNADNVMGGLAYALSNIGDGGFRAFANDLSEAWFENIRSIRRFEEAIEKAEGKKLKAYEMTHKTANASTSVSAREMEVANSKFFQPLAELVGEMLREKIDGRKMEMNDIEVYLISKHAKENNLFLQKRAYAAAMRKKIAEKAKELMKGNMAEEEAWLQAEKEVSMHLSDFRDDYSGLTELFENKVKEEKFVELVKNGMDEQTAKEQVEREGVSIDELEAAADEYISKFEGIVDGKTTKLWNIINDINKDTITKAFEKGLISRSLYNDLMKRHKYYIPLQGWTSNYVGDIYSYVTNGFDTKPLQTVIKKAEGTKHQARSIIGTMFAMNTSAIIQGNENITKQKLYNLAMNHNTGVLQVMNLWEVKDGNEWVPAEPPIITEGMSNKEVQKVLTDYEKKMRDLAKDEKARRTTNSLSDNFGKHATETQKKQHHIELLVNGQKVVLWVNGNPKLAEAINGQLKKSHEFGLKWMGNLVTKANQLLARTQTSLNPEFLVGNFERDILTASMSNLVQYGVKYQKQYLKNLAQLMPITAATNKAMRQDILDGGFGIWHLFKLDRNTNNPNRRVGAQVLDMNNPMHQEFVNFLNYGGKTGYIELRQADDIQTRFARLSKREQSLLRKLPANSIEGALNIVERLNEGVENAVRFAAYLTARENGKSITEAIYEAKEVSVNFNMRGSGAWGNAWFRAYYNYINVALQALRKEKVKFQNAPKASFAAWGTLIGLGVLRAMLGYGDDDDEEMEYGAMSEWSRYNYINVRLHRDDKKFARYAIPQEMRGFYAIGQISYEWANGWITSEQAMHSYATQLNNFTPLGFVPSVLDRNPDSRIASGIVGALIPSAGQTIYEAEVTNEDFLGRPIHNQNEHNKYKPEWQRAGFRTPEAYINFSKALSEATGGSEHERGGIEINPSKLYHHVSGFGGGTASFLEKCGNLVELVLGKEEAEENELRDYPFVSKVLVETDTEFASQRSVKTRYDMYRVEYEELDNAFKGYAKDRKYGKIDEETYNKEVERLQKDNNYWIYQIYASHESEYNKRKRAMSEANKRGKTESAKSHSEEIFKIKEAIVDEIVSEINEKTKRKIK
ncbi:MAG: hypothetical protein IKV15_00715 [Bacteroidaceae bacterium]|nr:hypothetical protein [Bacteroidaceae bacterium]